MKLAGKSVVVLGAGQTGVAVATFCVNRGANVIVTDSQPEEKLKDRIAELPPSVDLEVGGHRMESFTKADLVVVSPGIPDISETKNARKNGVEVIAEIELAYRCFHPESSLIAITGTNGKSTTTALTGALCEASGSPTFCGGNLGNFPLIDAVGGKADVKGGLIVAEVAGFMLETCTSFSPKVAACLNITEDHLDRFGTMENYAAAKNRIFRWQTASDSAIANSADQRTLKGLAASQAQGFIFSSDGPVEKGAFVDGDDIVLTGLSAKGFSKDGKERYPVSDLTIVGSHNIENAMAAYIAARQAGVSPDAIRAGSQTFTAQKHRMEEIKTVRGIRYFDDSKGTNVAAVAASLKGFPTKVVLIAGGVDKGGAYRPMFETMQGNTRALILIGQAAAKITQEAKDFGVDYPVLQAPTLESAVEKATQSAQPGDSVVLSPACSSYDMFKNFEARGMAFRAAIPEENDQNEKGGAAS